jgi:hypothetical protein
MKTLLLVMLALLSISGLCGLLAAPTPDNTVTNAVDVCSENPYYAEAIVALKWLEQNPYPSGTSGSAYSHAVLDGLYQQLLAEGKVQPVPPPCTVTAREPSTIWSEPGTASTPLGSLPAGEPVDLYGRSEDNNWWYVLQSPGAGWGWVSAAQTDLQPGTEIDAIPVR